MAEHKDFLDKCVPLAGVLGPWQCEWGSDV